MSLTESAIKDNITGIYKLIPSDAIAQTLEMPVTLIPEYQLQEGSLPDITDKVLPGQDISLPVTITPDYTVKTIELLDILDDITPDVQKITI